MDSNEQQQQNQQTSGTAIQVMPTTVLGTANGQQILLQSLQQTLGANGQQSIQVVPIQALGQGGTIIVQPSVQAQPQPQIVQLPDGQTFIYQPMIPETQAQPQIVNINGNFFQIPAQQTPTQSATTNSIQTSPAQSQNQPSQQVVMMTAAPTAASSQNETQSVVSNIINTTATSPPPPTSSTSPGPPVESEEEPLYVNASKLLNFYLCKFIEI